MNSLISERAKVVVGAAAVADAFAGTKQFEAVNMGKYDRLLAIVHKAVGTTGTSTLTVQCSSDAAQTGATAIPFKYRRVASGDTAGDITAAAAAGFTTTAGSNEMYLLEIQASDCPEGKPWVNIKSVEVADDPVLGGALYILEGAKYAGESLPTSIA